MDYSANMDCTVIDFYQALLDGEEASGKPLYADGVHPNAEGYAFFAEAALKVLAAKA